VTHNWKLSRLITCFCRSRKLVNCVYIYHIGILTMRHQSFYNTSTTSLHFVAENYLSGVKFGSMFLALSCYMTNSLRLRQKHVISLESFQLCIICRIVSWFLDNWECRKEICRSIFFYLIVKYQTLRTILARNIRKLNQHFCDIHLNCYYYIKG
jgi:hypothetical protein